MSLPLAGKCAIVTGSTSGIGLGVAKRLAVNGANLILNGIEQENDVKPLISSLSADSKVKILYSNADMAKADDVRAMIRTSEKAFGRLDILVNNAGVQHVCPIEKFDDDTYEKIIKINLSAPFFAIQSAFPIMKRQGYGRIINIVSTHGLVASVNKAPYVSAKHGLIGLTKAVALEGADFGITCNSVCPGWVLTELVRKQINDLAVNTKVDFATAAQTVLKDKQPLQRFVEAEEIGDAVVFLCGPSSNSITGATIEISGGWTAR